MTSPVLRRYLSLFMRRHILHAAIVYVAVRAAVTMALVMAIVPERPIDYSALHGADTALFMIALAALAAAFDRRRVGTPVLMANLGVSVMESTALSIVPALIGETLVNLGVALR